MPVHWIQYDELKQTSNVGLVDSKATRPAFSHKSLEPVQKYLADRGLIFDRGLLSFFVGQKEKLTPEMGNKLSDFFKKD